MPMTSFFTTEELVEYLYNEASLEKRAAIEAALRYDWSLREKLEVLKASSAALDCERLSPRPDTIMKVLNYARETMTEPIQH